MFPKTPRVFNGYLCAGSQHSGYAAGSLPPLPGLDSTAPLTGWGGPPPCPALLPDLRPAPLGHRRGSRSPSPAPSQRSDRSTGRWREAGRDYRPASPDRLSSSGRSDRSGQHSDRERNGYYDKSKRGYHDKGRSERSYYEDRSDRGRYYDGDRSHYNGDRSHYNGDRSQYNGDRSQYQDRERESGPSRRTPPRRYETGGLSQKYRPY